MAFNELESGELQKQERITKERDELQQKELERQKAEYLEMMKNSSSKFEEEKKQAERK